MKLKETCRDAWNVYREFGLFRLLGAVFQRSGDYLHNMALLIDSEINDIEQFDISTKRRLWLWKNGFLTVSGVFYGLNRENVGQYLSNYTRDIHTRKINRSAGAGLDNKLLFEAILPEEYQEKTPEILGRLEQGEVYCNEGATPLIKWIDEYLKRHEAVVLRENTGGGGKSIFVIEATEKGYQVNGDYWDKAKFQEELNSLENYHCLEYINQGGHSEEIYPSTVNTLRILTMVDPETHEPYIAAAYHRFGTDESFPVDNMSQGGISASVDPKTGKLGVAVSYPTGDGIETHETHPNTGVSIAGQRVSNWNSIKSELLNLTSHLYTLGISYIGYDIVAADEGYMILEGNNYPDVVGLQAHKPLLSDPDIRRFYESHDVI